MTNGPLRVNVLIILILCLNCSSYAEELLVGDSREEVIQLLGQPQGNMTSTQIETLFYDRGLVTLRDGKVSSFKLKTTEEVRAEKERRRQEDAARQAEREHQRLRNIEEGTSQKAKTLANPEFEILSPGEKLVYWRKFQRTYPDVPVTNEIVAAERAEVQVKSERLAASIRDMEQEIEGLTIKIRKTRNDFHRQRFRRERMLLKEELVRAQRVQKERKTD